ncbi:MAG: hypothetical protein P1V51_23750 [Deltaproteobacteria bacterium]|nr:hypothetical protein [Deltaproteobacteria bacterium]
MGIAGSELQRELQDEGRLAAHLERLETEERFESLFQSLEEIARIHPDPQRAAAFARRAARLARDRLGASDQSLATSQLALERDPSDAEAWGLLAELFRSTNRWPELVEALVRLGEIAPEPALRAEYFAEAADLAERELEDLGRAHRLYLRALRALPPWLGSGQAAARLLASESRARRIEAWLREEVSALGASGAAGSDLRRADLLLNLGRVWVVDPARREGAVESLLTAAELTDSVGQVALQLLGGLHTLEEGWRDLFDLLLVEAETQIESEPRVAVENLHRAAEAALEAPADLHRAKRALKTILGLHPEDTRAADAMVAALAQEGRHREAISLLVDLARVVEGPPAALYLIRAGIIELARFGDRAASLVHFEEALRRDVTSQAATHLEEAYRDMGRWRDLARVMLATVEGREVDAEVLERLREIGRILRDEAGDISAAVEVYRRITAHDAMDDEAIEFFRDFHERLDRDAPAIDLRAREARTQTDRVSRIAKLCEAAEAAVRLGSPARARSYFEAARAENPDDRKVRDRYFEVLRQWGDYGDLLDALERERARVGQDANAWAQLSLMEAELVYRGLGRLDQAVAIYRAVAAGEGPAAEAAQLHVAALERALEAATYRGPATETPAEAGATLPEEAPEDRVAIEVGDTAWSDEPAAYQEEALPDPAQLLEAARESQREGRSEQALEQAMQAIQASPAEADDEVGLAARELAADLLLGELDDRAEGLDRLAELGRDRRLPLGTRRRINEARVRILERDVDEGGARDRALADALADAAAVADSPEGSRRLLYRRARLLGKRPDAWRVAADILNTLLLDEPESAAILEALAEIYEREEQWTLLSRVLSRRAELARSDTEAAEIYARLADVAADGSSDPEEAVQWLRHALERCPGHRPALVTLARLAKDVGDDEAREQALRAWLAIETEHETLPSLHYALGETLEASGRVDEAHTAFRRAGEGSPGSAAAWAGMLRTARAMPDPGGRADALAGCAAMAPSPSEQARVEAELGRFLLQVVGDAGRAREAVRRALDADDSNLEALTVARLLAERDRDAPGVVADYLRRELWVSDDPDEAAERFTELGSLHAGPLDDTNQAMAYFRQALEVSPDLPRALAGLARLHLARDEGAAATTLLHRLLELEEAPGGVRAWAAGEIGKWHESHGDFNAAIDSYRQATRLDREAAASFQALARLGGKLGDDSETHEALAQICSLGERGVAGAPTGAALTEAYARLGTVRRRLGDRRGAIEAYRRALERDAVHREALRALSVLYEMDRELLAAAEMRERAAELIPDRLLRAAALGAVGGFYRDRVGDLRQAATVFQRAISLAPDEVTYHAGALAIARRLGRMGDARAAALECVRLTDDGRAAAEYLCTAAACAEAEGDPAGALSLARVALERDPGCEAALERLLEAGSVDPADREGDELLLRAVEAAGEDAQAVRWLTQLARRRQDRGDAVGAAEAIALAIGRKPDDLTLQNALASGAPPPPAAATAALKALEGLLLEAPTRVPTLLAVESLAEARHDVDRAYLVGAFLELGRAAPAAVSERHQALKARLPQDPRGNLGQVERDALAPSGWAARERFYARCEEIALASDPGDRLLRWAPVEYRAAEPAWQAEVDRLAAALGLESRALGIGDAGLGVRVLPDAGVVVVGSDLLRDRAAAEARFTLAFALSMASPGRRWASATRDPLAGLVSLRRWAAQEANEVEAAGLQARLGESAQQELQRVLPSSPPEPRIDLTTCVVLSSLLGLAVAGDVIGGLSAAMRLVAPGVPLPADMASLGALVSDRPLLGRVLGLVHGEPFLAARRALGLAIVD